MHAVEVGERGLVVNDEVLCSRDDLLEYTACWSIWPCGPTVRVVVAETVTDYQRIGDELAKCWPGANITVEVMRSLPYVPSHWS